VLPMSSLCLVFFFLKKVLSNCSCILWHQASYYEEIINDILKEHMYMLTHLHLCIMELQVHTEGYPVT
jgi:hypothetical protein